MDIDLEISNEVIKVGYNQKVIDKDLSKLNSGLRKWMDEHHRRIPYLLLQSTTIPDLCGKAGSLRVRVRSLQAAPSG